jgi:hypothetical protein
MNLKVLNIVINIITITLAIVVSFNLFTENVIIWPIQALVAFSVIVTFFNYFNVHSLEDVIFTENVLLDADGFSIKFMLDLTKRFDFAELVEIRFNEFYHFRFKGLNIFINTHEKGQYIKRVVTDDKVGKELFTEFISAVNKHNQEQQKKESDYGSDTAFVTELLEKTFGKGNVLTVKLDEENCSFNIDE